VVGQELVRVAVSKTGAFRYSADGTADGSDQEMLEGVPFGRAAEWILDESPTASKYYINRFGLTDALPKLLGDLRFTDTDGPLPPTLWFGSAGTSSPLHFDGGDNLHCQVFGCKRWVFFSPEDTSKLYPVPEGSKLPHLSLVDLEHIDYGLYPSLEAATPIEVELEPGDMVFVPAFWWHFVKSRSVSISVNRWWDHDLRQHTTPNSLRLLRGQYRQCVANTEHAKKRSPDHWLVIAQAVIDRSPDAAVVMGACALQRLAHESGFAQAEPRHTAVQERWQRLIKLAIEPDACGIKQTDAAAFLKDVRRAAGAGTES
jgi:hypothetical protein